MRKISKAVAALTAGCMLLSTSAFAAIEDNINGKALLVNGEYTVNLDYTTAGQSTIIVLKEGTALADANETNILYINQAAIADGKATYAINLGTSFAGNAVVYAGGTAETATELGTLTTIKDVVGLTLAADKQANYVIDQVPAMFYGGKDNLEMGAFECYFQILAPNNVLWKPSFMGSKENYQIRVYKVKNLVQEGGVLFDTAVNDKQDHIGACEANEWYRIVVFPLSDDGADETQIEFGISYYQSWTDQYINLYVNGEYNNIRWPQSGSNPKIINIRHTSAVSPIGDEE